MPLYQPISGNITTILGGGNVITQANGPADAAQKIVTVDDSTGFLAGARCSYVLVGGAVEYNLIDTVDTGTQITLTTNIGTGGIADNAYVAMISESEYQAAFAVNYGNNILPTLSTAMGWAAQGVWNVLAYGADNSGVSDSSAAIQAALDAAEVGGSTGQTGGIVLMPPGTYIISAMIIVPNRVMLVGTGFGGARLQASDTFDFDVYPAMVHLGAPATTTAVTYAGIFLENLNIDCHYRPRSIGVRTDGANEGCGIHRCRIRGWTSMAIQVNEFSAYGNAKNFSMSELDIGASGGDPAQGAGLYAGSIRTYTLPLTNITGSGSTVTVTAVGHLFKRGDLVSVADTTNHNETYIILSVPTADTFTIPSSQTITETSGTLTQEACGIMLRGLNSGGYRIDKATITTQTRIGGVAGKYISAGILLSNVEGSFISQLHLEACEHGILLGKRFACQGVTIIGVGAGPVGSVNATNLITLRGFNANTVLMALSKEGSPTLINNTRTGQVTTADYVSLYVTSYVSTDLIHNIDGTSYRTDTTSNPNGAKTPNKIGELYLSSTTGFWWMSFGLTSSSWGQLTA